MSVNEKMTAIADAIRDKTGGTDKLGLDDMSQAIPEVYDAGKQAQYDEFWDSYQNKGSRPFLRLFCSIGWNDTTFKPKYSMRYAAGANGMFADSRITDLQAILDRQGVTFDFSSCQSFANLLQDSTITRIGVVSTVSGSVTNIFYLAKSLETVDLLILKSNGSQTFSGSFQDCIALANITIEGVIGQNIDIHWSPLTKNSITSIINALSTTATGKTLTLKESAVKKEFAWNFAKEIDSMGILITDIEFLTNEIPKDFNLDWGEGVEIGEYILIYCASTDYVDERAKIVLKKKGTNIDESTGVDRGVWTVVTRAEGTYNEDTGVYNEADIGEYNDEWTALVEAKSNWTISLV